MRTLSNEKNIGTRHPVRKNRLLQFFVLAALITSLSLLHISRAESELRTSGSRIGDNASSLTTDDNLGVQCKIRQSNDTVYVSGLRRFRDGQLYTASRLPATAGLAEQMQNNHGAIYRIDESGEPSVLHSFSGKDGTDPRGDLLEARDGYLYGVTSEGAKHNRGAIFRIQPDGSSFGVLHEFTDREGGRSRVGLIESRDGHLYGVTPGGGAYTQGTVYQLATDGQIKVLHSFNREDGSNPSAALLDGKDGNLYSTTRMGGHRNRGVIYKLSADAASFAILHSFDGANGANPEAELAKGADGFLYGVASHGGANDGGVAFRLREDGSDFAVLHEFDRYDLENPDAPKGTRPMMMMISSDGHLYGTTRKGGEQNQGVAFRMQLDGSGYEPVHSFTGFGRKQLMEDADGQIVVPVRDRDKSSNAMRLKSIEQLQGKDASIQQQAIMQTQAQGTVFTVTNTADSGPGSLRQAIINANNNPGKDEIHFFIFGGGVHTITPSSPLPGITDVIIDGLTQPGASNATWPPDLRIELRGSDVPQYTGLYVGDNCLIRGLVITRFFTGISLAGNNNQLKSNFIGTDPSGIFDRGNGLEGIVVQGNSNVIGGATPGDRNLISGNGRYGLFIQLSHGNLVFGNYIGTNVYGNLPLGNENRGIMIFESSDNQVGGTAAGARNIISGNGVAGYAVAYGLSIEGDDSTGNLVVNNFIGTNAAGNAALANLPNGVYVGEHYLYTGTIGATDNLIGGTANGSRNLISGNGGFGVVTKTGNRVQGNYIGVDVTGSFALGNHFGGILVTGADNHIGGTAAASRNIVSGNGQGITFFEVDATNNVVQGNYIGTDATGDVAVGNIGNGIMFRGSPSGNLIGDITSEARNIISGNNTGVSLGTVFDTNSAPTGNLVQGNYIGLSVSGSPLGNSSDGVLVRDYSHNNMIGGIVPGAGNTIAYNGDGGIHIMRTPLTGTDSATPTGNSILGNSIFGNLDINPNPYPGLGIDLNQVASVGGDGVTQNDPGDADTGPNNLQNFPVITQGPNGSLNCSLNSTPNRSFRIEFFANSVADASGYGEGELFIGSQYVNTDASGNVAFSFTPPATPGLPAINATATDNQTGDTSEFSFGVLIVASQPPTLFCPPHISIGTDINQCSAVVNLSLYVSGGDGNGGNLVPTCVPASGSAFPKGTTTVTCSVSNAAGSATCSFPLTVIDMQQPNIQCPANITQQMPANQCLATVNYPTPAVTDNCPGVSVVCQPPAGGALFAVGVSSVVCVATDASGLDYPCFFTVTITDSTPPVIQCPANVSTATAPNQCAAAVNYVAPTVTDNCSPGNATICSPPSGATFPKGVTTVSCIVSDASGNQASCSFSVTVQDNQNPTLVCPANITVPAAPNSCSTVVTFTATATDNCPGVVVACAPPSNSPFYVGTTTVTCTAIDASGRTASCAFTVTVIDAQAPAITCPLNIQTNAAAGATSAVVNYTVIATDSCPGVTLESSPPSGSVFPVGTTVVTSVATDASGNTATCSFTITVNDGTCDLIGSVSADPSELWPPDHKMKMVTINYAVPDSIATCTLSVSSNEPINGTGDGDTDPDWQIVDAHHVRLRAERAGIGNGRVYMVTITCTDSSGYSCTATVTISVPHDN